jgi:hypothetical protein
MLQEVKQCVVRGWGRYRLRRINELALKITGIQSP